MKENKKSSIIIIVILIVCIICLIGFIVTDKIINNHEKTSGNSSTGITSSNLTTESKIRNSEQEKLINELSNTLITSSKTHGLYEKKDYNDEITHNFIIFNAINYLIDNDVFSEEYGVKVENSSSVNGDKVDDKSYLYALPKETLNSYIKNKYNIADNYIITDDKILNFQNISEINFAYDDNYYIGLISKSGSNSLLANKVLKYEISENNIDIYSTVVSYGYYGVYMVENALPNEGTYIYEGDEEINTDDIFIKYSDKLNTYRHTFKKDNNGNYKLLKYGLVKSVN